VGGVDVVIVVIFLRLTNRSIFDNQENDLSYSIYIVAIISVCRDVSVSL